MMPSGKAGFTTRTSTVMTPTIAPKIHLPVLVIDADTGELLTEQDLEPTVGDPLQLAGTIAPDQVLYQGTVGTLLRITP